MSLQEILFTFALLFAAVVVAVMGTPSSTSRSTTGGSDAKQAVRSEPQILPWVRHAATQPNAPPRGQQHRRGASSTRAWAWRRMRT